jgi:membrane protein DedA with SNARE-associated domain
MIHPTVDLAIDLAPDWTDAAAIGYPVLVGGVLLGSIVPVVPTGAVVGAAAAVATTTGRLSLTLVVLLSAVAALFGDVVTFAVARAGGPAAVRLVARGHHPERLAQVRDQFAERGWRLLVVSRLLPAGRVPVLLAAGALGYPWRRLLPIAAVASLLWSGAYTLLGVLSGGLFDSPLTATLIATGLVLVLTAVASLVHRLRRRARAGTR